VANASRLEPGSGPGQLGPVIDTASYNKIISYIEDAEKSGANKIVLDGRSWKRDEGNWVGPTIILHTSSEDKTMFEEVFGPVLSLNVASSWEEAIGIENANPFWKRRFHLHDRLDSERAWVGSQRWSPRSKRALFLRWLVRNQEQVWRHGYHR
jgi:acyl-CoA reductase-like NAD-dependent aldehyde dehydrogenase